MVAAGNGSMRWREATDVSVASNRFSPHRLGQRKSHDKITQLAAKASVAAGGDHKELFAVWARLVRHRRRLAAGWKFCAPEFFPRRAVELRGGDRPARLRSKSVRSPSRSLPPC